MNDADNAGNPASTSDTSRPMRVALVSCSELPEPDFDEQPLVEAFAARGHEAAVVPWDEDTAPAKALADFDAAVLRSPWNYHERLGEFAAWCDAAAEAVPLLNTPAVIHWNAHKRYLLELERAGISIVPTAVVERGAHELGNAHAADGWSALVIKPAVGAGSAGARLFAANKRDSASAYFTELCGRADALVQPVIPGFADPGERSIVWIDGEVTHAVTKRPRFDGQDESVIGGAAVTDDEREFAERCVEAATTIVGTTPLYARVDVVMHEGALVLSELELIEPSLFFEHGLGSAARFVTATERALVEASAD
ncbi:MAG: hypothetical protein AAF747_00875 [Planctomycetota bacterium]